MSDEWPPQPIPLPRALRPSIGRAAIIALLNVAIAVPFWRRPTWVESIVTPIYFSRRWPISSFLPGSTLADQCDSFIALGLFILFMGTALLATAPHRRRLALLAHDLEAVPSSTALRLQAALPPRLIFGLPLLAGWLCLLWLRPDISVGEVPLGGCILFVVAYLPLAASLVIAAQLRAVGLLDWRSGGAIIAFAVIYFLPLGLGVFFLHWLLQVGLLLILLTWPMRAWP